MTPAKPAVRLHEIGGASPVAKQSTALVLTAIAVVVTVLVPGLGVHHVEWLIAGSAVAVATMVFAPSSAPHAATTPRFGLMGAPPPPVPIEPSPITRST